MPKNQRGGQRKQPQTAANQQANNPQSYQVYAQPPQIVATQAQAQAGNNAAFSADDSGPYRDLTGGRQYYQNQNLTISQQLGVMNYLSPGAEDGSLYNMAQNMNTNMALGKPLTANQQYVRRHLLSAMHNLGGNYNLTRYDHETFVNNLIKSAGVNQQYQNLSEGQLKKLLVGMKYKEGRFVSTSYNDFVNAPTSTKNTFVNRAVKLHYRAKAGVQAMMPGVGPAGNIGEVLLAPSGSNRNFTITDVKFSKNKARVKGTQSFSLPQVDIYVDIDPQN